MTLNTDNKLLSFSLPEVGPEEISAVTHVLENGWLTTGLITKNFEAEFAQYVSAHHAIALNSCTAALHLALEAIGLRENDEVLVPTMTFAATAEVVRYFNAKPVLIDCRPDDMNIDSNLVEQKITPQTKAIIPVHFAGQPCDLDPIHELAKKYSLRVIEDAAHSLPASYKNKKIGSISDMTCFSFYATKTMTTGEGGMITTHDTDLANRIRIMSLHGISKDAWKRYSSQGNWRYDIEAPGYKYNLTDIASAIGIEQLKKCDEFARKRKEYAELYLNAFRQVPDHIEPLAIHPDRTHAWHLFVIKINVDAWSITRDTLIDLLKERGIMTSVHFIPLHLHSYYIKTYGIKPHDLPVASSLSEQIVSLPLYSKMTLQDVNRVIENVLDLVSKFKK